MCESNIGGGVGGGGGGGGSDSECVTGSAFEESYSPMDSITMSVCDQVSGKVNQD